MTTALISGICGFVASHLTDYLLANTDWDVVGTLRWQDPTDNLATFAQDERVSFQYADLRDSHSMRSAVKSARPDYVFHLAAQSFPLTSFTAPNDTLDTNVQGTVNLLEAVREFAPNAWVHVCSSSEVYGRTDRELIDEDCPFAPASPYAISKAGTDMLGRFYAEAYDMRIVRTRMFTHTGPRRGDVFAESSFAKQIATIDADQKMPQVIKTGYLNSVRTIADVRDAVRAYHMALTVNPIPGEVYNIGGVNTMPVRAILARLLKLAGRDWPSVEDPSRMRPLDVQRQKPDCTKFKTHTGWEPEIGFEQTMTDLLNYWRERVRHSVALER